MNDNLVKTSELKESILNLSIDAAQKMSNPEIVKQVSSSKKNAVEINGNLLIPWNDISLSHGFPGLCILFGELDYMFPDGGWDIIGLSYLKKVQLHVEKHGIYSASAFSGLAGIGFAARSLSRNGTRYTNFIKTINEELVKNTKVILNNLKSDRHDVKMSDYDVIEGVTGIGRYLLLYQENAIFSGVLQEILNYLIHLTKDIDILGKKVPGWFIPSNNLFLESERIENPVGNFNCGLSHGIPGPLALLSIALDKGVEMDGQKEAIDKIGGWLTSKVIKSDKGDYFPTTITWEEQVSNTVIPSSSRDAWCYGTPGVARSLYLAGKARNNIKFIETANKTFNAIFERSTEEWDIYSPTFCHGFSGLLYTTMLMKNQNVFKLVNKVLTFYNSNNMFGFQDIENSDSGFKHMNKSGFLDGATGTLLTLLSYYNKKNYTEWDTLFLLN